MKKISLSAVLLLALWVPGCSWFHWHKSAAAQPTKFATTKPAAVVTPDLSLAAKVVSINTVGRFVVLNFPADKLPKLQQTMFIYRSGLKVAEVKITGPQDSENNIVADLVSGDPRIGDNVRAD
jgi:hypothetical protein